MNELTPYPARAGELNEDVHPGDRWRVGSLHHGTCVVGGTLCLVFTTLWAGCATLNQPSARAEGQIRDLLEQQARDWNNGSLERFMDGYARRDDIRFASGGEVERGWQTVFDRYVRKYGDRPAMGRLTFSDLEVTLLSADAAVVLGRWRLNRENDAPSGLFTLLLRKLPEGWRIVHDHTSATEKK